MAEDNAFLDAFMSSPVATLVTRHRRMILANRALERMFGYGIEELRGKSVHKLYPSSADFQRIGERCESHMRLNSTDYYEDERFMQDAQQMVFWVRARGTTLTPDDPFAHMVWVFDRLDNRSLNTVQLTRREREIAKLIVNGLTSKQIAQQLGISFRTVDVHRGKLMRKLGVRNAAELVSEILLAI